VRFLGEVTDVLPVLHAADAMIITSDVEGMPGVAIEALMCGVPVLATDVGALSTMPGVRLIEPSAEAFSRALDGGLPAVPAGAAVELGWPAVTERWIELFDGSRLNPRRGHAERTLRVKASQTRVT
jgi:glycosyltransferase involved in cell wall biosynthesis